MGEFEMSFRPFFNVLNGNYEQNSECKAIWTINLLYHDTGLGREFEVT
jgi:hypothetical protein